MCICCVYALSQKRHGFAIHGTADLGGRRELQRRWQRSISLAADRQRLSVDRDWGFGGGGDPPACTALREDHPIRGVGAVAVGVYARWVRSEATSCSSPRRLAQRSCNLQRARAVEFVPPPCLDTKVGRTCQMPCFIPLSHCQVLVFHLHRYQAMNTPRSTTVPSQLL
ncbi:uncharacterized protein [Lolium perenne]|uniref:uncharacterized protein isoform X2 n=1 Tax=Lolium perenne TaxID=4522 RepID=UPI003A9A2D77